MLSAHRLSTIKDADKIVVLSGGNVVEEGTHHDLLGNPDGAYSKLVNAQKLREEANEEFQEQEEDPEQLMAEEQQKLGDELKKSATTRSAASIALSAKQNAKGSGHKNYGIASLFFRIGKLNSGQFKVYAVGACAAAVVSCAKSTL